MGQETNAEETEMQQNPVGDDVMEDLKDNEGHLGHEEGPSDAVPEERLPMTNSQKVLEWMGLYYAISTGVNPPWLTVDAGGRKEVSFNLGNWLLAGVTGVLGYVLGRAGVAIGRVAVKTYTGV